MSFWDKMKEYTTPYADDGYEYDTEDDFEEDTEPAPRPRRRNAAEPVAESAPERSEAGSFSGKVLNINSNKPSVVLFRPTRYGECTKAADDLRARKAVIVNMEDVEPGTACRVVDFLSGCAYALDGKVRKIATDTYLFCPQSMDVMGDLETIQTEAEAPV